jgi:hypothetical protein
VATEFFTGQRLTADLLNGNLVDFMPQNFIKGTTTSRQNNTYADDPDLQGIVLTEGTWSIRLGILSTVASTTPKLRTKWIFTGTWNTPNRLCIGPGSNQTADSANLTETSVKVYNTGQDATYNFSTSGLWTGITEWADSVVVTAEGSLSLQWAQVTTTASNVDVKAGTAFTIQKLA